MASSKVVVITGASQGLGLGMAERLAQRFGPEVRLGLCARREPRLADARAEALCASVDVTSPEAVEAFTRQVEAAFGAIDLWVNNAGVLAPLGLAREVAALEVGKLLDINIKGVIHGSQSYLKHRHRYGGGGVLVNISSGAAQRGIAGWSAYCASKAAVDRFTEALQLEEQESGLRAYAIAPGVVDTEMQAKIRALPLERFPHLARFHEMKQAAHFNSPAFVADALFAIAFDSHQHPHEVVVRLPNEWEQR